MSLHRFWIKFKYSEAIQTPLGSRLGFGVTASGLEEALEIIRSRAYKDQALPQLEEVIEDVDVSALDAKHVLPNIGLVTRRGIWFPVGYE